MEAKIIGVIMITLAVILIAYKEKAVRYYYHFQKNNFGIKVSEDLVKLNVKLLPVFAMAIAIIGTLLVLGLI